jgi:hypothetical protein
LITLLTKKKATSIKNNFGNQKAIILNLNLASFRASDVGHWTVRIAFALNPIQKHFKKNI